MENNVMENYSYEYVEGQGSLVAIPRLENGHLIAAIYPIQPETGVIYPSLSYNDFTVDRAGLLKSSDTFPESAIYAVAEDGSILIGTVSRTFSGCGQRKIFNTKDQLRRRDAAADSYYDADEGKRFWLRLEAYFYRSNHSSWSGITARWYHRFELEVTVE